MTLHAHLGAHRNIIKFLSYGEDEIWVWLCMELAEGGDLFDKIEADEGVGEDVAHFYFTQLVSAIGYMHSRGIAHRDIKPENILLSGQGDLKIADFGLAALFMKDGLRRTCSTICGSPPYVAPEVLTGKRGKSGSVLESGYAPDAADLWSCGIVLFVLFVGNTPWDEPTRRSPEFSEYVEHDGRSTSDELWQGVPSDALSLLRGLLKLDARSRFTLDEVRKHPWFTRPNPLLSPTGAAANPLGLATKLLEALRVDFDTDPAVVTASQRRTAASTDFDAMDIDSGPMNSKTRPDNLIYPDQTGFRLASTQPETPLADTPFDWETSGHNALALASASQPVHSANSTTHWALESLAAEDPALSQFSSTPSVPLTLTQHARKFRDIVPAQSLTRFLSTYPLSLLLGLLSDALHRLGIPGHHVQQYQKQQQQRQQDFSHSTGEPVARLQVRTTDGRGQMLHGNIVIEEFAGVETMGVEVKEVRFLKAKGDPVEWRRFFKRLCVLCKEGIYKPNG